MTNPQMTTREAVEALVERARRSPSWDPALEVHAAAALALAAALDAAEVATQAANASRELRHHLEVLRSVRPGERDPVAELRAQHQRRKAATRAAGNGGRAAP